MTTSKKWWSEDREWQTTVGSTRANMLMEVICGKLHGNNLPVSLTSSNFTQSTLLLRFARCSVKCQRIAFVTTSSKASEGQDKSLRVETCHIRMILWSKAAVHSTAFTSPFVLIPEGRAGTREKAGDRPRKAAAPQSLWLVRQTESAWLGL